MWSSLFRAVELKLLFIKNIKFCQLRTKTKNPFKRDPNAPTVTGDVSSALHIFAMNKQVNEHNVEQLLKTCPEYVQIGRSRFGYY